MRLAIFSVLFAILVMAGTAGPAAARRVALVIGNDAYSDVPKLQKAVNDARAMAKTLREIGFKVIQATNLTRREMNLQLHGFTSQLEPGDEALFYYAGHGLEIEGQNFLLPIDIPRVKPGEEELIKADAILVDRILALIQKRNSRISILVLDACRNNPFPSEGTRSVGSARGLARIPAPEGTFIMFSAGVGQAALDRLSDDDANPNSVFTRSLIPLLKTPGISLTDMARQVRRDVLKLAKSVSYNQRPAYYDEVTGDFFFTAGDKVVDATPSVAAVVPAAPITPAIPATPPARVVALTGLSRDAGWPQNPPGIQNSMVCKVDGPDRFLSIRAGPGTNHKILRRLKRLAIIEVDTRQRRGHWVRVVGAYRTHSPQGIRQTTKNFGVSGWAHDAYLCDFLD